MADITVNPDRNREQQRRNRRAWENFAHPETDQCQHCPHDRYDHIGQSEETARTPDYFLTRLFCLACAEDLDTGQVVCYRRAAS